MERLALSGKINRQTPPRASIEAAFDRRVQRAMLERDADALEQLCAMAIDQALIAGVMGGES